MVNRSGVFSRINGYRVLMMVCRDDARERATIDIDHCEAEPGWLIHWMCPRSWASSRHHHHEDP